MDVGMTGFAPEPTASQTGFPSQPDQHSKGDTATARPSPEPVGYLRRSAVPHYANSVVKTRDGGRETDRPSRAATHENIHEWTASDTRDHDHGRLSALVPASCRSGTPARQESRARRDQQ